MSHRRYKICLRYHLNSGSFVKKFTRMWINKLSYSIALKNFKTRKIKVLPLILMKVCSKNNLYELDWLAPQNLLTLYDLKKKTLLTNGEYFWSMWIVFSQTLKSCNTLVKMTISYGKTSIRPWDVNSSVLWAKRITIVQRCMYVFIIQRVKPWWYELV